MTRGRRLSTRIAILLVVLIAASPAAQAQSLPPVMAWQLEIRGSEDHQLRWPVGVASASVGEIVVADAYGSRLLSISRSDVGAWEVSSVLKLPGTPQSLDYGNGRYFVSLREGEGVVTADGKPLRLRKIALPDGTVPGAVSAHPAGGFMVWDAAGARVLSIDELANLRFSVDVEEHVVALAATSDGGFLTVSAHEAEVRRYSPIGELRDRWEVPGDGAVPAWPTGIAVRSNGDFFVVDRHNGRILAFDSTGRVAGQGGRRGWEPGLLRFPLGVALMPDGGIAVADQGNSRVQIFRSSEEDSTR